jgi:hypothetical protein
MFEIFIKQGFLLHKTCFFLCPILELKLIGLDSVDIVLVDFETEQVETAGTARTASLHSAQ